ncbi:DUF488 domain-containing protein [Ramlibacter sp. USB13]|uniref:DUF488 domain-containing protein n=1 Tax=Ramlibacter cellulosilyticus TaxID=2764187 RepID=A0A923MNJ1_9BURK|nr:DUF488 domain-containing protein [Ramlibacter cellulosilyticus]MBC5782295.1 DUF488 domain-containing protein [Ramlibacter cellulosilyticus]
MQPSARSPATRTRTAADPRTVWTIGHSTRSADDFVSVLRAHGIEVVADVRRFPGSRRHPQFGSDALAATLAGCGLGYAWLAGLGGRRRVPAGPEQAGWRNASFRSYAAYTWTEEFASGLDELLHVASGARTAIMCSELLWWRCHRALISDVLRFLDVEVIHIAGTGPGTPHPYTSPACIVDGELAYPEEGCC